MHFMKEKKTSFNEIIKKIKTYQTKYITVTGGEPLAQSNCHQLLTKLADLQYQISLETSGAMDISKVDTRIKIILDIKTPASLENEKNNLHNLFSIKSK